MASGLRDVNCPTCGRLFFKASVGGVTVEVWCKTQKCRRVVTIDLGKG